MVRTAHPTAMNHMNAMGEAAIQVDFNHPLAGHTNVFDVEVLDVVPADRG